tara:strand:+ start:249 stop:698 length:450 start_codon:yes stop_codon:yes gene_type:complete
MSIVDETWQIPTNLDFKADTLHKAIVKLQRLNAAQHFSEDDWHLNMIEATKDLTDEEAQYKFIEYLANPSGYKENDKLWDQLEEFDKQNTSKVVQRLVEPDNFEWDDLKGEYNVIGSTMYIHVKNENWKTRKEEEEEDEKKMDEIPDLD